MHSEDLLIDNRSNGQAVEAISERLPEFDVVPSLALIVEAVYPVDGSALVISAKDEEIFWVFYFVGK